MTGWILIHAGRKLDEEACRHLAIPCESLTRGAIVGCVKVEGWTEFDAASWNEARREHLEWSDYQPGMIGWRLNDPVKFANPVPWSGNLGLFEIPGSAVPELPSHIRGA